MKSQILAIMLISLSMTQIMIVGMVEPVTRPRSQSFSNSSGSRTNSETLQTNQSSTSSNSLRTTAQQKALQAQKAMNQAKTPGTTVKFTETSQPSSQKPVDYVASTESLSPTVSRSMVTPPSRIFTNESGIELTNMGEKTPTNTNNVLRFDFNQPLLENNSSYQPPVYNEITGKVSPYQESTNYGTYQPPVYHEKSSLEFNNSLENLTSNSTSNFNTPLSTKTPSFLETTKNSFDSWINNTKNSYQQNQAARIQASNAAAIKSLQAQRPLDYQVKIDNPTYKQFLTDISYTDLFKNLTTPNNQPRSNGYYTTSIKPIITDMFNKALISMNIPESVLTSPRFVNQKYQQIKTSFANQTQKISQNTKITLQEKQTQLNQVLTNLSQNLSTFFSQLGVKATPNDTVISATTNPIKSSALPTYDESFNDKTVNDSMVTVQPENNMQVALIPGQGVRDLSTPIQQRTGVMQEKSSVPPTGFDAFNEISAPTENAPLPNINRKYTPEEMQRIEIVNNTQKMLNITKEEYKNLPQNIKVAMRNIYDQAERLPEANRNNFIANELQNNKAFDSFDIYDATGKTITSYAVTKPIINITSPQVAASA